VFKGRAVPDSGPALPGISEPGRLYPEARFPGPASKTVYPATEPQHAAPAGAAGAQIVKVAFPHTPAP
jgi:hypothetical protein